MNLVRENLPINAEAERMVLGLILLKPENAYTFAATLEPSDFGLDSHRRIYTAIQRLSDLGKPVEYISIEQELNARGELEAVGGSAYIMSLTEGRFTRGIDPEHYAGIVKKQANLRRLIHAASSAAFSATEHGAEPSEVLAALQDQILEISSGANKTLAKDGPEAVRGLISMLDRLSARKGQLAGLSTGVPGLDEATSGIRDGELWVIGARPGQGKTSLARQIARVNVKHGIPTLFYSLEMASEWIAAANVAAESGVRFSKIREGRMNRDDLQKIHVACDRMMHWPLYIVDEGGLDVREIVAHSLMMIRQSGIRLVIVDYLQIVNDGLHRERLQQVAYVSNRLRVFSKNTAIPIVLLSQLARPKDADMRPKIWQLKESGDIEAHAHVVVLPYLPQDDNGEFTEEDELIVAKQRFGQIGPLDVIFRKDSLEFVDREKGVL